MFFKNKTLNRYNELNDYLKAILIAIPFSVVLLVYLISIGAADLIFAEWFIALISIPTFLANPLSFSAYVGRLSDLLKSFKKTLKESRYEFLGTAIGMAAGIAVGVGLMAMNVAIPLTSSLFAFAGVLFLARQIAIFTGLGNRLGRCADKDSRPQSEKVILLSSATLGLILGIVLFATATAAMVSVVGITAFFSGGASIPVVVAGIIFVLSMTSGFASSADYIAKSISFIRAPFISNKNDLVKKTVQQRHYEYGGSLAGISTGLIIGLVVVTAIVASNPFVLAGVVGAIAGTLIIIMSISIFGSLGSRIGRIIDGVKTPPLPPAEFEGSSNQRITQALDNQADKQADKHTPKPSPSPLPVAPTRSKSTLSCFSCFWSKWRNDKESQEPLPAGKPTPPPP